MKKNVWMLLVKIAAKKRLDEIKRIEALESLVDTTVCTTGYHGKVCR